MKYTLMFFLLLYIGQQSLAQVEVFYDFSSYQYRFEDNIRFFESVILFGSSVQIDPWIQDIPWPGVFDTSNTCFAVVIIVYYSDNTDCTFFDQHCNVNG